MHDADDLVVTVLTGRRPKLLQETLDSLALSSPGLLETCYLAVLHNGGDDETKAVTSRYRQLIDRLDTSDALMPIPNATATCATMAEASGRRFWLHLEDDWRSLGVHKDWLNEAQAILDTDSKISQIRLRHHLEPVLKKHMVTGEPLVWQQRSGYNLGRSVHKTWNPALVRTEDAMVGFPARDEKDHQRQWMESGRCKVAQLLPGEFVHIGEQKSLAASEGSRKAW